MVNFKIPALDRTFAALADPTRRALLARLGEDGGGGLTVSELARPFAVSLPAVMKHLAVLSGAGLIERRKRGRTVTCRLTAAPMEEAMAWLARYQLFWTAGLERLAAFVEEDRPCSPTPPASTPPAPSSPASRSSAASRRRRPGSTRPGRSRNS
jgi:DNA-binding transcriptional ArsR family regulator